MSINNKIVYVTRNEEDYVGTMADAFAFPSVLPKMMLVDNPKIKNDIIKDFEESILPS